MVEPNPGIPWPEPYVPNPPVPFPSDYDEEDEDDY
jgi:hypothetical protein